MVNQPSHPSGVSRRQFIGSSTVAGAGLMLAPQALKADSNAFGDKEIRVGLIGCGGRGSGAAQQTMSVPGTKAKLTAMADAFLENLEGAYSNLSNSLKDKVDVPPERRFVGFDAYQKVFEHCDLVILATPPGFRPDHFAAAVEAGKHVFVEKPVAVDAPGIRKFLEAVKKADEKNLRVVAGLQRRYEPSYLAAYKTVHEEGLLGEITGAQVYWNSEGVWVRDRKPEDTEIQYQMRNWYYFNWLCGDHIVEQHVHNIDVANWFLGSYPIAAQGMGGRQVRVGPKFGEIYDHHFVEFTYKGGIKVNSQCRHQPGCMNAVHEEIFGTKGRLLLSPGNARIISYDNKPIWSWSGKNDNPYQVEHNELHKFIREGVAHNDGEYVAKSTFTAILGRLATYGGQLVKWDEALASNIDLRPENLDWNAQAKVLPDKDGLYPCAIPGKTKVI